MAGVQIPYKCLSGSKFSRQEQQNIITTFLSCINRPVSRSRLVYVKVKGLGEIFTHANKKNERKKKYFRKYQQKKNKAKMREKMMSEEVLLF